MISFVWSARHPFLAGSGGSETYTAGHIRELLQRGIDARLITIGHGRQDGRQDFPDIPFLALSSKEQLAELDDTIVYVTYPLAVRTKHPSYAILHCPPPTFAHGDPLYDPKAFKYSHLVTASRFAAGLWRRYLRLGFSRTPTVYPYADAAFRTVERTATTGTGGRRILYAGRLKADKGIYTLLSALHMENLEDRPFTLTTTTAGSNIEEGRIILKLLQAHPRVDVVDACRTPADMAKLMAAHDVVVMPSTNIFWQELFGMISIEAQQAGCRVVASRAGGLPETNLGSLILIEPDNPKELAKGLEKALDLGPLTKIERQQACQCFTVQESVDKLLRVINYPPQKFQPYSQKVRQTARQVGTARLREAEALWSQASQVASQQLTPLIERSKPASYVSEPPTEE